MTFDQIETAIGQHLESMTNCPPIAWPNKDYAPDGDLYLEFRHTPNDRIDDTLTGDYAYQIGLILVTVIVRANTFTGQANEVAQSIADHFPRGKRLSAGEGKVLIDRPVSLASPFVDGVSWRTPVRISYQTEK